MTKSWYEFKNAAGKTAEVFIYDEIGGWGVSASEFVKDLKTHSGKEITVRLHSPGGSVLDGHAIYNALARHKGGVTVQIDGLAASMASVIAMTGKPVKMAENAFMMIHNPSGGVYGEGDDMRKGADLLDKMRDGLVNIYAKKSGKDPDAIEAAMNEETWFTAQEAMDYGLVDEITDSLDVAASFDLTKFTHAPSALVDTTKKSMATITIESLQAELATVSANHISAGEQAKKNFADYRAAIAERDGFKAELEAATTLVGAQAAELVALKAQIEPLKTELATLPEKVNAEAQRTLAASGHLHPVAETGNTTATATTSDDILEQFNAIKDPAERIRFYRANKAAYDAAFRK